MSEAENKPRDNEKQGDRIFCRRPVLILISDRSNYLLTKVDGKQAANA